MNDTKQIQKRLQKLPNMAAFGRAYRLPYRTLQRIKAGASSANTATLRGIESALDRAGK